MNIGIQVYGFYTYLSTVCPKKITIGLSASITSKVLNESKYDFRL